MLQQKIKQMQQTLDTMKPERLPSEPLPEPAPPGAARRTTTGVPVERLRALATALWKTPEGFSLHPKIARVQQRRRQALENESTIGWPTAEELAFASILEDGVAIRLSGEDTERGTFSQRHAALYDVSNGQRYVPLHALTSARAAFEVRNSPLSENAIVAFEYGYSIQKPGQLVIWEAQYGDFVNGAQVMLDEFVVSARAKWGQRPSLVLLLPHGYEGQGPNHSSCRIERFLDLAMNVNLRVANCTSAAQYFHLLRRQAALLQEDPLPLVILTPKSLLRDPRLASPLEECASGAWQPVIDAAPSEARESVRRLVLCSGKIFLDLNNGLIQQQRSEVAIVRLEQLAPYPAEALEAILVTYPALEQVHWVQEEPENMGAWNYLRVRLARQLNGRWPLLFTGRPASSSPAEGSASWHRATQNAIVANALQLENSAGGET
jgi:2-oxoglutarate dehydrogenase E1 component